MNNKSKSKGDEKVKKKGKEKDKEGGEVIWQSAHKRHVSPSHVTVEMIK